MDYNIFLDDNRVTSPSYEGNWLIAMNMEDVIEMIKDLGYPNKISLDHDLGENPLLKKQSERTGYDLVKYLVEKDIEENWITNDTVFIIHSHNPVGVENMKKYLENYWDVSGKSYIIIVEPWSKR